MNEVVGPVRQRSWLLVLLDALLWSYPVYGALWLGWEPLVPLIMIAAATSCYRLYLRIRAGHATGGLLRLPLAPLF